MPCESILLQKLGSRLPLAFACRRFGPYLTRTERALIHDWIAEGARDN